MDKKNNKKILVVSDDLAEDSKPTGVIKDKAIAGDLTNDEIQQLFNDELRLFFADYTRCIRVARAAPLEIPTTPKEDFDFSREQDDKRIKDKGVKIFKGKEFQRRKR